MIKLTLTGIALLLLTSLLASCCCCCPALPGAGLGILSGVTGGSDSGDSTDNPYYPDSPNYPSYPDKDNSGTGTPNDRDMYSVTFVTHGGDELGTLVLKSGDPLPDTYRYDVTFGGWYSDPNLTEPVYTVPSEDITLYAHWL